MKNTLRLIRRFVAILLLSSVLLILLNITLFIAFTANSFPNAHPWQTAADAAAQIRPHDGGYILPEELALELKTSDAWAILIDNTTMQVIWQTDTVPETVPTSYTASDIAHLTRGYIDDYPTFTGESEHGLMVLGYPKDRFWKHMWPSWDYQLIAGLPKAILSFVIINVALIFIIYVAANSRLLKSVKPIVNGIQSLPAKEAVSVRETGLLSELAKSINRTSEILQSQNRQLSKKETARANWIAGVSHDIRTPLSMILGYACQLKDDTRLTDGQRQKAAVIVKQSERMRDLINDLNLASKLEYNMQPLHPANQNLVSIIRQVVVDFINTDIDGRYPVVWETDESLTVCPANVDSDLIRRAVSNLIQNSINHNPQGCTIHVRVADEDNTCTITVADDGTGITDEQMERLNNTPHYMVCDENIFGQRHGLGLLLVKQIAQAHGGAVVIGHSSYGGFSAKLIL